LCTGRLPVYSLPSHPKIGVPDAGHDECDDGSELWSSSSPLPLDKALLTAEEIEVALAFGYELRGLELKGRGTRTDPHLFAKVTRACLSMANLRDGGHVIIGIDDNDPASMMPGLDAAELASWLSYDDVARRLAEYAEPPIRFDLDSCLLPSGATVAVIQVHEFADIPVLCVKDYPTVLRAGACYVRPRRVPETAEIPSAVEMRDLLDLATEKALRAFVERAQRAGLALTTAAPSTTAGPSASERFLSQRRDIW
jgi:hypothetical protein